MVMTETPTKQSILEELTVEELIVEDSRWNDAGLTSGDLAEWRWPGFQYAECELLEAIEHAPTD